MEYKQYDIVDLCHVERKLDSAGQAFLWKIRMESWCVGIYISCHECGTT